MVVSIDDADVHFLDLEFVRQSFIHSDHHSPISFCIFGTMQFFIDHVELVSVE